MAENIGNAILQHLECTVLQALANLDICNERTLKLMKKTRDYKSGDIIIPAGCVKLEESKQAELLRYVQGIYEKTNNSFVLRVSNDKSSLLSFHLDRSQFCKAILKEIHDSGNRYGYSKVRKDESVFTNSLSTRDVNYQLSLTNLRLHVVTQHVEKLLQANGYEVIPQDGHEYNLEKFTNESGMMQNEMEQFLNPSEVALTEESHMNSAKTFHTHCPQSHKSDLAKKFIERAKLLSSSTGSSKQTHICGNLDSLNDAVGRDKSVCDCGHGEHDAAETVVLDIQKLILDRKLFCGNDITDKNLHNVTVIEDGKLTNTMDEAIRLAEFLQSKQCHHCLHVVPHYQVFKQQQVQLTLATLSDEIIHQSLLVIGPVITKEFSCSGKITCTAQSFFQNRYLQMDEVSKMRNGGTCKDQISDKQTLLLTSASIKLDLLGNTSHTSLRIDASSRDRGAESRLGVFVLYNTARLATLMSHFSKCVDEGLYPPLPPVDDIDCSLLREEDDWELVFQYLAAFPDVVRQSVEIFFPADGKNMAQIHTHKVTNFLVAFTKCLSAHYSRYHVLTGGEAHLLPLMYARLHLMKSAHQVLLNSLHLVGVEALPYL